MPPRHAMPCHKHAEAPYRALPCHRHGTEKQTRHRYSDQTSPTAEAEANEEDPQNPVPEEAEEEEEDVFASVIDDTGTSLEEFILYVRNKTR